ncbi:MAG: hypothetical protein ACD_29C00485G0002 [uncultured bacterium]|nr:MAG: hypothetical protein ACD_29C00485G0002 [uncultured bacterium]
MRNVIIIEPSSAGLELLPAAKSMNLGVFVFTSNTDERIVPSQYHHYIDRMIKVDTYDVSEMHAIFQKINQIHPLSAIIPGSEYHVPIAAYLAKLVNLPGVVLQYVNHLRIKSDMRKCLKQHGIRQPRYVVITDEIEINSASQLIGFPCVLKPVASAGSMHVSRVNTIQELSKAYQQLRSDPWSELGKGIGNIALIEEYINGEEFSVEGFIGNSNVHIISITKKFLTPEPFFIEMGHIVPANISMEAQTLIKDYVQEVIKSLCINLGVFHVELRIDTQGLPILMEIAGRLPGCRISDLIQLATENNLYRMMIQSHLGLPIRITTGNIKQYAGMRYFTLKEKNGFTHVNGINELQAIPGFYDFNLLKKPGEYVPPLTTFLGRVAMCIFTAPTYEELKSRLDKAVSVISFS